jgi:serine/threonine protein phosphatase PrpC
MYKQKLFKYQTKLLKGGVAPTVAPAPITDVTIDVTNGMVTPQQLHVPQADPSIQGLVTLSSVALLTHPAGLLPYQDVTISGCSHIGGRPHQEDKFVTLTDVNPTSHEGYTIVCVFDGHGGSDTSEYVSLTLPVICRTKLNALPNLADPRTIMTTIIQEFTLRDQDPAEYMRHPYMGSTGTVCVITSAFVIAVSIGDSPGILFKPTGQIIGMTPIDDCANPNELARINADATRPLCEVTIPNYQARLSLGQLPDGRYDYGLDMTRAFGDTAYKPKATGTPSAGQIWPRNAGDILCVCSDSFLERSLTQARPQTMPEIVVEVLPVLQRNNFNIPYTVAEVVLNRVRTIRGDNTTMILVRL